MRKLSLFMLMAVGLLISGNVGAVNQENGHAIQQEGDVVKMTVDVAGVVTTTYYATLQDAFDDLPTNSYPATITVLKNIEAPIVLEAKQAWTVPAKCNLTFDLNGKSVYTSTNNENKSSALIKNNGTLTIKDGVGGGYLTNTSTTPDVEWQDREQYQYPTYANDVILNSGTVIVESGTIENGSVEGSGATYCIENNYGANSTVIINGGKLISHSTAVRFFGGNESNFTMNGGIIEADRMGFQINGAPGKHKVNLNDGVIISKLYGAVDLWVETEAFAQNITEANINGGTYYGSGSKGLYIDKKADLINFNITGGVFMWETASSFIGNEDSSLPQNKTISGGVFKISMISASEGENLIKTGYTHRALTEAEKASVVVRDKTGNKIENFDFTNFHIVVPADEKSIDVNEGEQNLKDIVTVKEDGTTNLTIVPNTTSGETSIINVTQDTKINKLDVTTTTGKGEAQIVVKNGVTLDVGNGGIVSENNDLTTVRVETGGTLIIGTNGIDKLGNATPIEIEASEEKGSGVLIFSPNSKVEDTQKYAEVDLYTYCKKVGEKYYWQQFAIPVTGLANDKVVKNPNKTSYVFAWDYPTYSWTQLSSWDQLNEPFAGYDMTNVSEAGGVVYTFKGDLIGNQNKQLTLPHKDYCVMGNSYTAPIDIPALFDQINKEMDQTGAGTIEKTVYKYDAKAGYYVYTNELEQELDKIGIAKASFTEIKPMEGFLLNLQSGNTAGVMLNYANAVYTPAMTTNTPATAPRMNSNTDMVVAKINVKSAHAMDQMTLVEGDEFSADIENGKDAFKYLNEGANLYAFDGTNKLAMVATDNLEGTMLAFQAAEDAEYTLTFDRALNTEYVLVDMMNGNEIAMTEGNTYTFFATPNTLDPARFMIKANAQAPTNMESTKATKVAKGIYTITGQYLGESNQWNAVPQGVYMVNGVKVIK